MKIKLLKVVFYFVIVSFVIFNNIINAQYLDPNSFSSLGNFNPGSNVTVNMGTNTMSGGFTATGVVSGGILVFTFDTFTLNSGISITFTGVTSGGNKIAFLSKGDMTIAGNIYANASGSTPGPGGYKGATGGAGTTGANGEGPGGGTGNNIGAGGGGFGGAGGKSGLESPGGGTVAGDLAANFIGGSGGGQSEYAHNYGEGVQEVGGGGGGALELGAKLTLTLQNGCKIEAKGAAGGNAFSSEEDGNGGGSGGGILIHSRSVVINSGANIDVSGGAGGNGYNDGIGCGGGGGGGGKVHIAYYTAGTITNNGNIIRSGGTGGSDTYNPGVNGSNGPAVVPISSNNEALPVELQSFTATPKKGKVILNWSTATEVNNYGFQVQRKKDKVESEWELVGFVEGSGNSNSVKEYSFTDNSVTNGKYSYRVKQIDTDGAFEYSDVVEVVVKSVPEFFSVAQNFPNPGNPTTNINFSLPKEGYVVVKVYDILGKEIATLLDETRSADTHSVTWNGLDGSGKEAASGIYLYNIFFDGQSVTKKMLLVR